MSSSKPTFFFVHGAWHQSAHFEPIMKELGSAGYPSICVTRPTYDVPPGQFKTITLDQDVVFLRAAMDKLIDTEEREVIVVCHSYGGVVGTQAVHADYGIKQRAALGKKGGVLRLVYLCGFILPPNASLGDAFGGDLPPIIKTEEDGSCNMIDPRSMFYGGLNDEEAQRWIDLLKPHPAIVQLTPISYMAYQHHPVSYIIALGDVPLPLEVQRQMIAGARENGIEIDVHEVDSPDHSPYLSKIPETTALLEKIAAQYS